MKVIDNLFKKGLELGNQRKYSEAAKWYWFYNKYS